MTTVRPCTLKTYVTRMPLPDKYEFSPVSRSRLVARIQRAMFDWLVKRGALQQSVELVKTTELRVHVGAPCLEAIYRLILDMQLHGYEPAHIYFGPDAAQEFMQGEWDKAVVFSSAGEFTLFGTPWTVIPWMQGWVVVPQKRR